MPIYQYQNPLTGELVEIPQRVNEEHVYSKDGVKYTRVFTVPNAAVDTKIDAFSQKDFARKTSNKKGTLGDLYDQSREASEKRAKTIGKDPVKEKYWADYSKKRGGKKHPKSYEG